MKIGIAPRTVNMKLFNSEKRRQGQGHYLERSTGQLQTRAGKNTEDEEGKGGRKEDRQEDEEYNERMGTGLKIKNRKGNTRRSDNRI